MNFKVIANRYKKNGTISRKPIVVAMFLTEIDAIHFINTRQNVMDHGYKVRTIGKR